MVCYGRWYREYSCLPDSERLHEQLHNITVGHSKQDLNIFLHGYCDIFADALNKRFGYKIVAYYYPGCLIHVFAYSPMTEKYYDIRGEFDSLIDILGDEFNWSDVDKQDINSVYYYDSYEELDKDLYYSASRHFTLSPLAREVINDYEHLYQS